MASQADLYNLARQAGLSNERAKVAAAVGMAESGGNAAAHNTNASTGDNSYGLWQINMLGAMGPARRAAYGLKSNDDLFNPKVNAQVMSAMSKQGQDFSPWSTYKNGAYKKYMGVNVGEGGHVWDPVTGWVKGAGIGGLLFGPLGVLAGGAVGGSGIDVPGGSVVGGAKDVVLGIPDAVKMAAQAAGWIGNPQNWVRVAYVIVGGSLAIAGAVMVVQSTGAGKAATKAAVKVATKGAIR